MTDYDSSDINTFHLFILYLDRDLRKCRDAKKSAKLLSTIDWFARQITETGIRYKEENDVQNTPEKVGITSKR